MKINNGDNKFLFKNRRKKISGCFIMQISVTIEMESSIKSFDFIDAIGK